MCAVQVGQHLGRHLGDSERAESRLDVVAIAPSVLVHRPRRSTLTLELTKPLLAELVYRCPGADVAALLHFGDERCSSILRLPQCSSDSPSHLPVAAGERVLPGMRYELEDPWRNLSDTSRFAQLLCHRSACSLHFEHRLERTSRYDDPAADGD